DHSGAQYNLGLMCLKGEGVSQDALAGLSWIELAADNGDKGARELLQRIDQALVGK
ncbi:MAG: SEL1-like repeat protein, partial [Alphaproteobacteria bacterium]|nr:SEL1-like repeat protein [Alphaproteobacteria bacterium]